MQNSPSPPDHPAGWSDERLLRACEIRFVRRSGPGGQHRNKTESGVQLIFEPTGAVAEANERRSQADNRRVALGRLRRQLAVSVRQGFDASAPLPEVWQQRVQRGRIVINPQHDEFPVLLAIAMNCLAANDWEVRVSAEALGCSATQLVRFLAEEPAALSELNRQRAELGLSPLRR